MIPDTRGNDRVGWVDRLAFESGSRALPDLVEVGTRK